MKKIVVVIVIGMMIQTMTNVQALGDGITECPFEHDHSTEICEVPYYGSFLDWANIPHVYEYNWDNSQNAWNFGVWYNGIKYTTPINTFDIDVRHKISMHHDKEYVYLNITHATDFGSRVSGSTLQFYIDGKLVQFQLVTKSGGSIDTLGSVIGTHEIFVNHDLTGLAGKRVDGAQAKLYIRECLHNGEYEVKIPLSEFVKQNPSINLDMMNTLEFQQHSLTNGRITSTGISTFPMLLGAACLVGVASKVWKEQKNESKKGNK